MAKKKAKDLKPKGKHVRGGGVVQDMDRIQNRDVRRLRKGIQKAGQRAGDDVREIPK